MDQGPLVKEQIDAGAALINDFQSHYKPLSAAFWLKEGDEGQWYLYLVSDQIDHSNFPDAYGAVIRLLGRGPHLWLGPFQVKVTGIDHPVAKSILEIQQTYPGSRAARLRDQVFGTQYFEEAYVYPVPMTV